jgi:hypothetical protein
MWIGVAVTYGAGAVGDNVKEIAGDPDVTDQTRMPRKEKAK